jgi:mono/diheme cytochrome c family protein
MIAQYLRIAAPAAALILLGAPASADEPGPGGFKSKAPVTGEEVYKTVCQACHMADAKGGTGAGTIPALAKNPNLAASGYPIIMVVNGRGAMPSFRDLLKPPQIANVVNYVRTHFGNDYKDSVKPEDVVQAIPQGGGGGH